MPMGVTRLLRILTPVTATMSLVLFGAAITTNDWLHSEEKMPITNFNRSGGQEFLSKLTISGLWKLCFTDPGKTDMQCFNIDYFPKAEYSPDPYDSTMAIPYAVTRASAFYFLSTIMLFFGAVFCLLGHCIRKRRVFTFISGCTFIVSGLMMLAGLVIYISTFKSEVGVKLQPQSTFQPPLFSYRYGVSFLFVVSCFMVTELAGTCAIFLYINMHNKEWNKKELAILDNVDDHMVHCQRHPRNTTATAGGQYCDLEHMIVCAGSRQHSPIPSRRRPSLAIGLPLSESMRDLSFYSLPPVSRELTVNTVSTTVDINRDYSREFSYETLRRTTPV